MTKGRRLRLIGSTVAAAALVLAGCGGTTTESDEPDTGATDQGGSVTVAETNAFFSFNPDTGPTNMDINTKVVGTTRSDFQYIDPEMNLVKDESFGTIEKLSDDPLTVKYQVSPDAAWSDGNRVDKADLLLEWAATSGHFDGDDPDEGPVYFDFAGDTAGLGLTDVPEFSDDSTMTVTYSEPYTDWEIAFSMGTAQPAHVVADLAGMTEEELVDLLQTATPGEDNEKLAAVAEVWNTGFNTKTLPDDPALFLSSGPMIVSEMVEDQSITLVRNETYKGDLKPKVDEITVRFIGNASAAITALRNGEVDIIAPQPSTDTIKEIKKLDDVTVLEGPQLAYDHIDLTFDSEVFKDADVREAFLLTVPREEILDRLIRPMYSDAEVLDSQLFVPSDPENYAKAIERNGSKDWPGTDVEKAKELLNGRTPTVKILYNSENPIRVDAYSMIEESATKAGFKIEDLGNKNWGQELGSGSYDASIFGWISPGVGNADAPQLFKTRGGGNYNGYSNPATDKILDELLVETDADKAVDLKIDVDQKLWEDFYGLPLFQSAGVIAHTDRIDGIKFMANQTGVWWNFWEWAVN